MKQSIELCTGWQLAIDPENNGKENGFAVSVPANAQPAPVPGVIQQVFTSYHGVAWYYFRFTPETVIASQENRRLFLCFGAVDYYSEVFVDGVFLHANEGAENEFRVDVTDKLTSNSLLAVRVINPKKDEPIDGFELTTIPHRNKIDGGFAPGASYNSGGITLPVTLKALSVIHITDCFVRGDWKTGRVQLDISVQNDSGVERNVSVLAAIRPSEQAVPSAEEVTDFRVLTGGMLLHMEMSVPSHKLWDIDSPNMYELALTIESEGLPSASYTVSFGFRDFRLKDGYFYLNGRRIFLKSAHTGNQMPEGLILPAASMPELEYKDLQLSKAAGFNCIRFIAGQPTPRQLDYCDRLGLMVYSETYASWLLGDSNQAPKRYWDSILAEVKRDRNHPCITIWGALNETMISDAYYAARAVLQFIRSLDNTRLCIFSSGRFDWAYPSDRDKPDYSLGCAANPESWEWEQVWGDDGVLDENKPHTIGDYHFYPAYPYTPETLHWIRSYGAKTKPCFLSEHGIGSHLNVIEACLEFERHRTDPTAPDYLLIRSIRDRYLRDYERYGMENTYADPVEHLRDSEKYNAISRRDGFDAIRSNEKLAGYNLTGLLDHAICGEGPYTLFRRIKPCNFDVLQDGWSPLRWCLFLSTGHIYSGDSIELEAVLADEEALRDGEHHVVFSVTDESGTPYYRRKVAFTVPVCDENGCRRLAYPVCRETVKLELPPGKYSFCAYLQNGGVAAASEKDFYVSARPMELVEKTVAVVGLPETVGMFLMKHGVRVTSQFDAPDVDVILVGKTDADTGRRLLAQTAEGILTVFLDPDALRTENGSGEFLPLAEYRCDPETDWVYHKESVAKRHPFFAGLKTGFLDWRYYSNICPTLGIHTSTAAESYASVNFYVGGPGEYHSSVNLAVYRHGRGELVLNTFPIIGMLDKCPAADRLLLNLLSE